MQAYVAVLTAASFVAAVCAGFILASSPRQRATQLAASLAAGASWWALCEARWNAAPQADVALVWMQLSAPGWCFLGGVVPHLMARYLDMYPGEARDRRARLLACAGFGYAIGTLVLSLAWLGHGVHGALVRVPWGWDYEPGPVLPLYLAAISPGIVYAVLSMLGHMRSPVAVAPRAHRISIRAGIMLPVLITPLTDIVLPVAGIHFPRLGSTSYALFGLVALGTGLRYGMTFFTPKQFSEEILETIHEGVAMITATGLIRRANRGLAGLVGRPAEMLVGTPLEQILLDWSAQDPTAAAEERQARLRNARGEELPVSASATPLHDRRGNALGLVVVVRDLREVENLRRHMLIQARLAAVGELVAGLAHEINNPLAFVRSNLALLERHAKLLADADALSAEERDAVTLETRELVEESLVGVDRAAEIVRGVRRFTHAGTPDREPANLNALLEDAVSMLRPRVRPPELVLELRPEPVPSVLCAPQEMRQVFLNLLVNALDAVGSRGRVVAATRVEADDVVVEVRDDGCGMDPDTLERIFDPFFTTKRVGEGTGLGLGIAWNIVRAQGGQIEVRSEPGVGTTFRVRLPMPPPDADAFDAAGAHI